MELRQSGAKASIGQRSSLCRSSPRICTARCYISRPPGSVLCVHRRPGRIYNFYNPSPCHCSSEHKIAITAISDNAETGHAARDNRIDIEHFATWGAKSRTICGWRRLRGHQARQTADAKDVIRLMECWPIRSKTGLSKVDTRVSARVGGRPSPQRLAGSQGIPPTGKPCAAATIIHDAVPKQAEGRRINQPAGEFSVQAFLHNKKDGRTGAGASTDLDIEHLATRIAQRRTVSRRRRLRRSLTANTAVAKDVIHRGDQKTLGGIEIGAAIRVARRCSRYR